MIKLHRTDSIRVHLNSVLPGYKIEPQAPGRGGHIGKVHRTRERRREGGNGLTCCRCQSWLWLWFWCLGSGPWWSCLRPTRADTGQGPAWPCGWGETGSWHSVSTSGARQHAILAAHTPPRSPPDPGQALGALLACHAQTGSSQMTRKEVKGSCGLTPPRLLGIWANGWRKQGRCPIEVKREVRGGTRGRDGPMMGITFRFLSLTTTPRYQPESKGKQ